MLKVDVAETLEEGVLLDALWSAIVKLYGEHGASRAGLSLIRYDKESKVAIIRVANEALEITRASLAALTKIDGKSAAVHVLQVSGTLKSLRKMA